MEAGYEDIFLSYSHDDRIIVEEIARHLQSMGFHCWIDKDMIRANDPYNQKIIAAIDNCSVFICFLSKTYVNKPYCINEFDRAHDKSKPIMDICIDEVNELTNRQCAYMFAFSTGLHILGFHIGIQKQEDIKTFAEEIAKSPIMLKEKEYYATGNKEDLPSPATPDYLLSMLRQYHEKQYVQSGNYALNEIRGDLFPGLKDTEFNVTFEDENKENTSLLKYLAEDHAKNHILIIGEGGIGKTVTLLKTAEALLSQRINAVYIPLSKIEEGFTLETYLERVVFRGNLYMAKIFRDIAERPCQENPQVVFLLDGINELPLSYATSFIQRTIKNLLMENCQGVRLVMTSRWFDHTLLHRIEKDVSVLEALPLDDSVIDACLNRLSIPVPADSKVRNAIRTPLMLTMYTDVEKHREKYQNIQGIELEENPDSPCKILHNFFQAQLYRASEEASFDRADHLVLLEYLMPAIAWQMETSLISNIPESVVWDCIEEIENKVERYRWYRNDRLRRLVHGLGEIHTDSLFHLAVDSLHFLNVTESGCEFLHQNFREYFAAYHVANEIRAFAVNPKRRNDVQAVLEAMPLRKEIIRYVSDLLKEEKAKPIWTDEGIIFAGKKDISPSAESKAEQILSVWRGIEGDSAQNAVRNLVEIMKEGRRMVLAWCDFSGLDFRKTDLSRVRFTEWYEDRYYPSVFDNAWLDKENLLSTGHEKTLSILLSDFKDFLFSGDTSGEVRIYDLAKKEWAAIIHPQNSEVIDLAWNAENQTLAILYEHVLFVYSFAKKRIVFTYGNQKHSRNFRYVRYERNGNLAIAYHLQPLTYYDLEGNLLTEEAEELPARCAVTSQDGTYLVRSRMFQMLEVKKKEEGEWKLHPGLTGFDCLRLKDFGAVSGRGITSIVFHPSGKRFLVTVQNLLLEFDMQTMAVLNRKVFDGYVRHACYMEQGIAVAHVKDIILLDEDFVEMDRIKGTYTADISYILEDHETGEYYLFSARGLIKKLNRSLEVMNIRSGLSQSNAVWIRNRETGKREMAFLPFAEYPYGARYDYDRRKLSQLGWNYEIEDVQGYDEEQTFYNLGADLMVVETKEPYRQMVYTNHAGIYLFRCSFRNIKGNMREKKNLQWLKQNGGIVDE
ncbi:MAG: toll/interleukin-1 receptor domain-containing protein [Solobacterium sp.]|nr:toll/interleukin-1 receptor domain-containing protein [Solobacterium sp.]